MAIRQMMVLPHHINGHVSNAKKNVLGVVLVNLHVQLYQSLCFTLKLFLTHAYGSDR